MTWYCQACKIQNSQKHDACRGCQEHWSRVWKEPVKRRSRSKSKGAKQQEQQTQKDKVSEEWQVFPTRVPWIPSTPATRHVNKQTETPMGAQVQEASVIAQPPHPLPALSSKEESLTEAEKKKLTHLRGLKTMDVELPMELEEQLTILEEKEKEANNSKAL